MTCCYAIVLRLAALHPGAIQPEHGEWARSALLRLIQAGDPQLAADLHDKNQQKSYTVALLEGGQRGRDGALHFGEGGEAFWRFTLLGEPAFDAVLRRYLLNQAAPQVQIGAVPFAITDAYASPGSHPAAGSVTLRDLQARWDLPPEKLPPVLRLRFLSPTVFNMQRERTAYHYQPVPEPRVLFSSLRKRWLRLGGAAPGDEFDEWVEAQVRLNDFDLHTHTVRVKGKRPVPGFVGTVSYQVGDDPRWWGLVHLLADLAFWTGIGYQTTAGWGQVRRVE